MTALPQAEPGRLPPDESQGPVPVDLSTIEQTVPPPIAGARGSCCASYLSAKNPTRQEWVRTALAVGAFASLVAILVFLLVSVPGELTADNIEQIATVVVTPSPVSSGQSLDFTSPKGATVETVTGLGKLTRSQRRP
jgi:hypothetical protein